MDFHVCGKCGGVVYTVGLVAVPHDCCGEGNEEAVMPLIIVLVVLCAVFGAMMWRVW